MQLLLTDLAGWITSDKSLYKGMFDNCTYIDGSPILDEIESEKIIVSKDDSIREMGNDELFPTYDIGGIVEETREDFLYYAENFGYDLNFFKSHNIDLDKCTFWSLFLD